MCESLKSDTVSLSWACGYSPIYRYCCTNLYYNVYAWAVNNYPYGGPLMTLYGAANYNTIQ